MGESALSYPLNSPSRCSNFKKITQRCASIRVNTKPAKTTLIACYSTTDKLSKIEKQTYYKTLLKAINKSNKNNFVCILGDFDARLRSERGTNTIGIYCIEEQSKNRENPGKLAERKKLVICNTIVRQTKAHLLNWPHQSYTSTA